MATYMKIAERKVLARRAGVELLGSGTAFQDLSLRALAEHLGWSLGTLHRAYSIVGQLLNDMLLEYEGETYSTVYAVGDGGLRRELQAQAHRMRDWMADGAHEQMIRYQMALVCRAESPVTLPYRGPRTTSWTFHRDNLVRISVAAGEEYADLNALTSMLSGMRDGTTYQFFQHGDVDWWLADNLLGISTAVALAKPRKVRQRASLADKQWIADQGVRPREISVPR
jgi:AcrR family transcriptional regulator